MATTYDEIFETALSLPPGFRAMLAERLLKSLDAAEQAEIDALWAEEAEKRVQATDSANAHINKWLTQDTPDEESQQLLVVEETKICLHAFSYTREQLIQEIAEQISFMWEEYVKADESTLAKDALRLRQELLNRLEEVQ